MDGKMDSENQEEEHEEVKFDQSQGLKDEVGISVDA